jgi:hypothetical protein
VTALTGLDPATYTPHPVHDPGRSYPETNCYMDILVELLHARGDEPLAVLGTTLRTDFEGDQFTFFKPPPDELEVLYGIDIHEMQPYRYLPEQAAEHLAAGRTLIVELDSYYLPDTASTSYRTEHVKSSVVVESVDVAGERLRYFHNCGLYDLHGDDFRNVFTFALPPYTELVRFDAGPRLTGGALRGAARALLPRHLARRPATNPFTRFAERLATDLPSLVAGDPAGYHAYAFATVRMAGAGFDLAASYVDWLFDGRETAAAEAFRRIVEGSKTLSFKLARRKAFDPEPALAALAGAWDEAQERLDGAAR